jgi:hypothetical protein
MGKEALTGANQMRNLKSIPVPHDIDKAEELRGTITIFEKIEYSDISKDSIRRKIYHLRTVQVPNRDVLLEMDDEELVFYWFKNWLHPDLKHYFPRSPRDKRGCSQQVLIRDARLDMLHFYENGQQNYNYTLDEIEDYAGIEPDPDDLHAVVNYDE